MTPESAAIGLRDELKVNICHELLVPRQFTELKATNNSSVEPSRKAVSNLIAGTQLLQHGHHAFKAELGSVAPPSSASSAWPPCTSAAPASFCHFADLTQRCMKSRLDNAFCEQRQGNHPEAVGKRSRLIHVFGHPSCSRTVQQETCYGDAGSVH